MIFLPNLRELKTALSAHMNAVLDNVIPYCDCDKVKKFKWTECLVDAYVIVLNTVLSLAKVWSQFG